MRLIVPVAVLAALTACGSPPTAESCAEICASADDAAPAEAAAEAAAPAAATMTSFENDLLSPLITDIREGVRPFHPEAVGLCEGKESCDKYLGMTATDLAPGDYILQAELRVPKTGAKGTWKVKVDYDCTYEKTSDNGTSSSNKTSSREYDVVYAGESRGYRLVPLRKITSPNKGSNERCTWKITAPHPDGDKVYEGSWSVPVEG